MFGLDGICIEMEKWSEPCKTAAMVSDNCSLYAKSITNQHKHFIISLFFVPIVWRMCCAIFESEMPNTRRFWIWYQKWWHFCNQMQWKFCFDNNHRTFLVELKFCHTHFIERPLDAKKSTLSLKLQYINKCEQSRASS